MILKKIGVVCLALTLFASCAVKPKQESLANYVNRDILSIGQIELEAFQRYAAVTGKNYTTDQAVYNALKNEVIPVYKRFAHLLNQIQIPPDDMELAKAHGYYRKGSKKILKGLEMKLHGIEAKNEVLISLGNQRINAGIQDTLKWRDQILNLKESRDLLSLKRDKSLLVQFFESFDNAMLDTGLGTD
jgi:hypothetical protein